MSEKNGAVQNARLQRGQAAQTFGRAGFSALAGVGRERENPRSERSEPAALKVQLGAVREVYLQTAVLEATNSDR